MYIRNKLIKSINTYLFKNTKGWKTALSEHTNLPILMAAQDSIESINTNEALEISKQINDLYDILYKTPYQHKSNLVELLKKNIDEKSNIIKKTLKVVSSDTKNVIDILKSHSDNVCIVGGFIRDELTKKHNKDIDFVTDTHMNILVKDFESKGWKVQQKGKQFQGWKIQKDGNQFDISNFRKDKDNIGGKIGNIYEDAQRRDFTINALYYNLKYKKIIDPNGQGLDDINDCILRFVGNPSTRIIEDPLRVFRFYRFLYKGFKPDNKSLKAVRQNFEYSIKYTSAERIKNEIEQIVL